MRENRERSRDEVLADAAIEVISREGLRGLTHRAVDAEAALPTGSASNRFRSRQALVIGAVGRLATITLAGLDRLAPADPVQSKEQVADLMAAWTSPASPLLRARLELSLESLRSPEVRAILDDARIAITERVDQLRWADGTDILEAPHISSHQLVALFSGAQWSAVTSGVNTVPVILDGLLGQAHQKPARSEPQDGD